MWGYEDQPARHLRSPTTSTQACHDVHAKLEHRGGHAAAAQLLLKACLESAARLGSGSTAAAAAAVSPHKRKAAGSPQAAAEQPASSPFVPWNAAGGPRGHPSLHPFISAYPSKSAPAASLRPAVASTERFEGAWAFGQPAQQAAESQPTSAGTAPADCSPPKRSRHGAAASPAGSPGGPTTTVLSGSFAQRSLFQLPAAAGAALSLGGSGGSRRVAAGTTPLGGAAPTLSASGWRAPAPPMLRVHAALGAAASGAAPGGGSRDAMPGLVAPYKAALRAATDPAGTRPAQLAPIDNAGASNMNKCGEMAGEGPSCGPRMARFERWYRSSL